MNVLDVNGVVVPDGFIRIYVKEMTDIPEGEEEGVIYVDLKGDGYCFFEGGVYIYTEGELE